MSINTFKLLFPQLPGLVWWHNQLTKQDDFYPKQLFTANNLITCLEKKWNHLTFLLPGVILNELIGNESMNGQQAQIALRIGIEFMSLMLSFYHLYSYTDSKINDILALFSKRKFQSSDLVSFKGTTFNSLKKKEEIINQTMSNFQSILAKSGMVGKRLGKEVLKAQMYLKKSIIQRCSGTKNGKSCSKKRSNSIDHQSRTKLKSVVILSKRSKSIKTEQTIINLVLD